MRSLPDNLWLGFEYMVIGFHQDFKGKNHKNFAGMIWLHLGNISTYSSSVVVSASKLCRLLGSQKPKAARCLVFNTYLVVISGLSIPIYSARQTGQFPLSR